MGYQTGTLSSMNDLMSTLSTFVQTEGWTQDQYTAEAGATDGKLSLHKNSVYVHFAWNSSESPNIAMYQSLGFISAGTNLWAHTDDSGGGVNSVPSTAGEWNVSNSVGRFISDIGIGPYTSYFFFAGNGVDEYIHVALEFAPYIYRHFGFGELEKSWDWTGGEYCYAHNQRTGSTKNQEILLHSYSVSTLYERPATIHMEGLVGQPGSSKWGTCGLASPGASWSDRNGNDRIRLKGGIPGGMLGSVFNMLPSNSGAGFIPLTANAIFYQNVAPAPDQYFLLGFQPDVRALNIKNFDPKDEVTISGDVWKLFPSVRKQNTGDQNESENLGIAYKKIP